MKITSGIYRGRELLSPHSKKTHPMGSRERLALFNAIAPDLKGVEVLDFYAGTGALGFEALSRGAKSVTFVEPDAAALATIKQNALNLGVSSSTTLIRHSAEHLAHTISQEHTPSAQVIFLDPPYDKPISADTFKLIAIHALKPSGVLVLSHPDSVNPAALAAETDLKIRSTKSYAACHITIFDK